MPDTIDLIKQDHRKVEQLFAEFAATKNIDIAEQVCIELTVHARLEEELLYPLLSKRVDEDEAEHATEEHDEVRQIITKIEEAMNSDGDVTGLMTKLEETVKHHVEEEESEVLPHMQREVGELMAQMTSTLIQRKRELMQEEADDTLIELTEDELRQRS